MTQKTQFSKIIVQETWLNELKIELKKDYIAEISSFISDERSSGKDIYPKDSEIFNSLNLTDLEDVKVVIIGQDPYHGEGQAHGLSFSVREGVKLPPSLKNIYKELEEEFSCTMPNSGDLTKWAEQGVLLLNATLTVEKANAGSHQGKGWEEFTDKVIRIVNDNCENVVFLLWGAYAQKKGSFINREKHMVLKAPHPSPLSAYRGFLGCGHFKQANSYLEQNDKKPIDWISL